MQFEKRMQIIVGLGNPGSKYKENRHNVGFMALDEICRQNPTFGPWKKRFQALTSEGNLNNSKVLLVKPMTFMNDSGQSVGEALRFYKLAAEDTLVIYDEIDLQPSKFRIRSGGSSGGHNGIRSIISHIGEKFNRLRIGVGHPGQKDLVYKYVLSDFSKSDYEWLNPILEAIGSKVDLLIDANYSQFSGDVNREIQLSTKSNHLKSDNSAENDVADSSTAADLTEKKQQNSPFKVLKKLFN